MKKLSFVQRSHGAHWVGDGFPVRNLISYNDIAQEVSPFLMLDYAGPANFSPTTEKRGVGEHPHRGFETVTIVYQGEVEHRDSSGGGGIIGPGDVQWMTAASGLVHEEFHGPNFAKTGGAFEMVQLWVNLPAKDKGAAPGYQGIRSKDIPSVSLAGGAATARLIAGDIGEAKGPARTFSPVILWDVKAQAGARVELPIADGHTASLLVLRGRIRLTEGTVVQTAELAVLDRQGAGAEYEALEDATVLVLGGKPLDEPIVGYGPFVMNTPAEIRQAFLDYESGRMGKLKSG